MSYEGSVVVADIMIARVELLVHMLDVVMDQERKKTPEQKKITIKDLEDMYMGRNRTVVQW